MRPQVRPRSRDCVLRSATQTTFVPIIDAWPKSQVAQTEGPGRVPGKAQGVSRGDNAGLSAQNGTMLNWICPECGRENDPNLPECPGCADPQATARFSTVRTRDIAPA